jgi:hypothetical protein
MDPVSKAQTQSNQENRLSRFGDKLQQWPKGVSGNPGGRPRKTVLTEIYQEIFDDPDCREKIKQQVLRTMASKGMAGVLERREAGERTEGKVVAVVDMNVTGTFQLSSVIEERRKKRGNTITDISEP